jgi:hypothetical protein
MTIAYGAVRSAGKFHSLADIGGTGPTAHGGGRQRALDGPDREEE